MTNQMVTINETNIAVKEYNGQRVVTLKDIDEVHQRPEGTARKRFNDNKNYLVQGEDYFKVCASEIRTNKILDISSKTHQDIVLLTESGYLMLVKSLTDDLAWQVQRQLVNTYFNAHQLQTGLGSLSPQLQLLINLELKQKQNEQAIADVNQRVDNIKEIVALNPNSWRPDARHLIAQIARAMGGNEYIKEVQSEIFHLVDERAGVSLSTRLTNKRRRMADEGVCKSKRDKLNKVDVIADDKKLIEIYIAVVKEMAVKYGVKIVEQEAC